MRTEDRIAHLLDHYAGKVAEIREAQRIGVTKGMLGDTADTLVATARLAAVSAIMTLIAKKPVEPPAPWSYDDDPYEDPS